MTSGFRSEQYQDQVNAAMGINVQHALSRTLADTFEGDALRLTLKAVFVLQQEVNRLRAEKAILTAKVNKND